VSWRGREDWEGSKNEWGIGEKEREGREGMRGEKETQKGSDSTYPQFMLPI